MTDTPQREEEPQWGFYSFNEPQQVEATEVNGETVYFDCCACGQEDAVLAGYVATKQDATRDDMAYRWDDQGKMRRPAFYCQACWEQVLRESQ
jgi:hypothetical protein